MTDDPDVLAILNHRQPVDDQAVADAANEIGAEQISRWADQMLAATFELRTLDDKVPWLSSAHRCAILLAAFQRQVQMETGATS